MELDIHAGKRILYKVNGKWNVGELAQGNATVDEGLFLPVISKENLNCIMIEINDIFLESKQVEDWMRQYGYLMTKEEYIEYINNEDFDKNIEHAFVSDGEYYYYSINKFTEQWLNKQSFEYVVREE